MMKKFLLFLLVAAGLFMKNEATDVGPCDLQPEIPTENLQVEVTNCQEPPCLLKKGTSETIQIKFTPDKDIEFLTNDVSAKLSIGFLLPFIGVKGTNACENIYNQDGTQVVGCPLKKGETYLYKNTFPILHQYPKFYLEVIYALKQERDLILCFQIPAKIQN